MTTHASEAVFREYAKFYDTFYAAKDYDREVDFVMDLYKRTKHQTPSRVLDLGCGTGGHLLPLLRHGLSVHGVDRSEEMVRRASSKLAETGMMERTQVACGDIRSYRCGTTFDLVISMFAVMGYLTTNDDLLRGFETARAHLAGGGLFMFDVWHGSAVLHTLPETRIHEFSDGDGTTLRLVSPQLDCVRQVVTVNYRILTIAGKVLQNDVREAHDMRYFFVQEVSALLDRAGFRTVHTCGFLEPDRVPDIDCWNLAVVAEAV
jgi:SAM-dependent methyltransferase